MVNLIKRNSIRSIEKQKQHKNGLNKKKSETLCDWVREEVDFTLLLLLFVSVTLFKNGCLPAIATAEVAVAVTVAARMLFHFGLRKNGPLGRKGSSTGRSFNKPDPV